MTEPHERARVIVARSSEGNAELSSRLKRLGMVPIPIDTVEFLEPPDWSRVDRELSRVGQFDWVVLTSPRGASLFARRMKELGLGPRGHPRIAGVGEATADRLAEEGFNVGFVPSEYTTSALGRQLPLRLGSRVLLLRADIAGEEIVAILEGRGFKVTSVPIYRTKFVGRRYNGKRAGNARAVILGSPSEVEGLEKRLAPTLSKRLKSEALAMCIGPVTARSAREVGYERVLVPKLHTFDALLMEVSRSVAR